MTVPDPGGGRHTPGAGAARRDAPPTARAPGDSRWVVFSLGVFVAHILIPAFVALAVVPLMGDGRAAEERASIVVLPLVGIVLLAGSLLSVRALGGSAATLGFARPVGSGSALWKDIAIGAAVGVAMLPVGAALGVVADAIGLGGDTLAPYREATDTPLVGMVLAFSAVVTAPVGEEAFYRGLVLTNLDRVMRQRWAAIAVSAAIFALVHLNPPSLLQLFVFGLALGWLRLERKSLAAPIAAHAANNLISVTALLLGVA